MQVAPETGARPKHTAPGIVASAYEKSRLVQILGASSVHANSRMVAHWLTMLTHMVAGEAREAETSPGSATQFVITGDCSGQKGRWGWAGE